MGEHFSGTPSAQLFLSRDAAEVRHEAMKTR
jgi:hypothetical protein